MQEYDFKQGKYYFSMIKDKFESFEKVQKFRNYQKLHPWAKNRNIAIAYGVWWIFKIGVITYGPILINNIQTKFLQDYKKEKLERTIDSTMNENYKHKSFSLEKK